MPPSSTGVVYVACDHGAKATVEALIPHVPGEALVGAMEADEKYWESQLAHARLLICGTSDSASGRLIEKVARTEAIRRSIPQVLIEDFPGNFSASPAAPRLLFVESEFAARLARRASPGLAVHVGPAIRYDPLRRKLDALRAPRGEQNAVLWIGQPETEDALRTLGALMPALQSPLWFRAHPRDEGYERGAYAAIFNNYPVEDMTAHALDDCLRRRPRLVITQFSSVAVEAGFWGIPSLHVLLLDAGGRTLREKKGYSVPPWCEDGAAFLIVQPQELESVLGRALHFAAARQAVMESFDRYFHVGTEGAPMLIDLLYNQGLL